MDSFRRGCRMFDSGAYGDAWRLLKAHCEARPTDMRARLWLARALAEDGLIDESLVRLKQVCEARPRSAVPRVFEAVILFDSRQFERSRDAARRAMDCRGGALAEGIHLLSRMWLGEPPPHRMTRLLRSANADLRGRTLHYTERRMPSLPGVVLRDLMDEVGIGWFGYRLPPPWLFKTGSVRRIWRLLGRGEVAEAYATAKGSDGDETSLRATPALIAAAMAAGAWEDAQRMARRIPQYRQFSEGNAPRRSLNHFQVALFRGASSLMAGRSDESLDDLGAAAVLDPTSYLPRYLRGRALTAIDSWTEARREFVAACELLNPSLAVTQWKTLLHQGA